MGEPTLAVPSVVERPILFSGPMVRAILAGTKTMTRRVVKVQTDHRPIGWGTLETAGDWPTRQKCPYGKPGERLWVRETWAWSGDDEVHWKDRQARGDVWWRATPLRNAWSGTGSPDDAWPPNVRWRPSIHMSRWACRLLLDVTDVRVERLQDISEEDARAEGVTADDISKVGIPCYSARQNFASLWESINGPESWDANPWVWVVGFRRVP